MARVYEYDVFISYQREGATVPAWVRTHFYPRLAELLDDNVDHQVKIFFDDGIPGGTNWPLAVRTALLRTRILLPVCSPKYFLNEWCLAEWHSMARREKLVGLASLERPQGLIYPVIFCDSENFPKYAKDRRMQNLKPWNLPYPQFQDTVEYLGFHREVERIAIELADLIGRAPEWRPDWPVDTPDPDPPRTPTLPRF
ncbi:TIR domain-containing protein [Actinokineospora sp.]|uniref:TIR domain-containing protein n=1 Tax=Actinokineospora sp. TaxID=1872133 RepID=UPI004037F86E